MKSKHCLEFLVGIVEAIYMNGTDLSTNLSIAIPVAGMGIGLFFGMFGAGGSAFATPVLSLLGVPAIFAVASPLPAMVPAAFNSARRFVRSGNLDRRIAMLAMFGGFPGTIVGGFASQAFGALQLLIASGVLLFFVGLRLVLPDPKGLGERAAKRRSSKPFVIGASFVVGVLTGLLANGGGFLLVPMFMLLLGLSSAEASGTSMVTVGALTLPSLLTHWSIGHIDWKVAGLFAVGLIPGSAVGSRLAQHLPAKSSRKAFGTVLAVFAVWFLFKQVL
jgi:uncharacterized protein